MKKQLLAIILAVCVLVSLFAAPVSAIVFEPTPTAQLEAVTFTEKNTSKYPVEGDAITEIAAGNTFAIKISVTNPSSDPLRLSGFKFRFTYNVDAFETYTYTFENDDDSGTVGPDAMPSSTKGGLKGWTMQNNTGTAGLAVFAGTCEKTANQPVLASGEQQTIGYLLLKAKTNVENGSYSFGFEGENYFNHIKDGETKDEEVENVDFSKKLALTVTGGQNPTIGATTIDPTEVAYGSDEVLTMGATSTSNKDITSFVTFKVKDVEGNDAAGFVVNNGNELNVAAADAGTYTVTAEPNGDNCRIDESVTVQNATFTITKQEITAPVVAISNFAKGQLVSGLTVETATSGLSVSATCFDEDGNQLEEERFKAGTTYSISIVLKADKNHVLNAQTLAVTVNGGEEQTVDIVGNVAVVTATTADKDAPTITPNPINATYGDLLSTLIPTGTATFNGKPVEGTFAWSNKYNAETTVDNAGVNEFDVVFTPTNTDLYATVTGKVTVTVAQKEIDITDKLNTWSANEFTYDGKSHSVELKIDEDLVGIVKVKEYTGDTEAQAVGEYTASASLELVDPANYKFNEDNVLTREHTWKINKGDLAPTDAEKSVLFGTKEVTVTPADFGLTQDGIKIEVTHAGNSLITGYLPSDDMRSVTFMLRDTDKTDAANNASDTATLKFSSANYNEASGTLTIKIIDKNTDANTLQIDVPATVTYGDTVSPSVGESKPAGAGDVTFKFFDKDGNQVSDQPFPVGKYKVTASCEDADTIYTAEKEFEVVARELTEENVTFGENLVYTGNELTQTVTVTVGGKELTKDTDYTVTGLTGTEPGSYPVTVTGTGNYTGTVTKSFEIAKADISSATISDIDSPVGYTGTAYEPEVTVTFNGTELALDTDYTVAYTNNVNAGEATVTITGTGTHFKGSVEKHFTITAADLSGCTFAPIADVTYNTKAHTPEVTVAISGRTLEADKDYTVSYASNVNAGTATVTVTGKGNFTGSANTTFTIAKADLNLSVYTISSLCTETEVKTSTLPSNFFLADETETGFSIALTAAGGDAIFTQEPAVVDGENMITYQLNGGTGEATFNVTVTPVSSNYKAGTYDLKIQAYDKTNVSNRIVFESGSAVYTGSGIKYEKATIAGHSSGMRYTYAPDVATGATLDAAALPLTVGTYTVTATYSDASSYGYKTATFTITKATPGRHAHLHQDRDERQDPC